MSESVNVNDLQRMKRDGEKSVCAVAWDYQMAQLVDRVGVDIVSVGDSVGINLWGHATPLEITFEEMMVVAKAVRRGVSRALLSCDFPFGPLQAGSQQTLDAARQVSLFGEREQCVEYLWGQALLGEIQQQWPGLKAEGSKAALLLSEFPQRRPLNVSCQPLQRLPGR